MQESQSPIGAGKPTKLCYRAIAFLTSLVGRRGEMKSHSLPHFCFVYRSLFLRHLEKLTDKLVSQKALMAKIV